MKSFAIHQFHSGSGYGDGITNGMFYLQKILQDSGYSSKIYCVNIDERLKGRIHSFRDYEDNQNDILLVHYSLGTDHDDWIAGLGARRVLVYHNITPAHFFPEGSGLRRLVESGRASLARWAKERIFVGQVAVSDYNAEELCGWGYDAVATVPVLVDLDRLRAHAWNERIGTDAEGVRTLLFVGRLCEHKGQTNLVRMMRHLVSIAAVPVRLLLVGGVTSEAYQAELQQEIDRHGMGGHVELLGKLDDDDVYGLYRRADLYVSMSQHEGFGMPLVEAMALGLPVLASAAGSVAATLGEGGLVLERGDARSMAAAARLMLEEPELRSRVLDGQRRSVTQYEQPEVVAALEAHLFRLGFDVVLARGLPTVIPQTWAVEGPYDSSYSLAIVNRELARSLERAGKRIALVSRDGPGPYAPATAFLTANPDIATMAERAVDGGVPEVALRNQYPPHVADMRATFRSLGNYAWEESGFPYAWVDEFNTTLDLITVTSRFVAKVLRDNGVHTPIAVVGNGIDHMLGSKPAERPSGGPFRFLHISSCFPRKGVDVLLTAWALAFDRHSDVELVIKTFANPHNTIAADLDVFQREHPDHAPVQVIEADLDGPAVHLLYDGADCIVNPSRGEGFGLPLAEAMALGKPVVTTAYGGQSDFCTPQTAWLCEFSFAPTRSHIGVPNSVWVEPDPESLAAALRAVRDASPEERARRVESGRRLVIERYTWDRVAAETRRAIAAVREKSGNMLRLPRIGWVSSWNSRCGIATYSEALTKAIEPGRLRVFADRKSQPLGPDSDHVERCWTQGWNDPLDDLHAAILAQKLDAVVIQFNFGFFSLDALARLIKRLKTAGLLVYLCLHSTADVEKPDKTIRLSEISTTLATVDRLLVHSVHDLNRLKAIGLVENTMLFPHGLPQPLPEDRAELRRRMFADRGPVIACFGFLLPHKGLRELIRAFAILHRVRPKAHLLLLNSLYPADESVAEYAACRAEIAAAGLEKAVTLTVDFLDEAEILTQLGAADVVVYPYQNTQESASGAIRLGISSRTPVVRTPLPIFADVTPITHELPGISPADIAEGLAYLIDDPDRLSRLERRQTDWLEAHGWGRLSQRLADLIRGEAKEQHHLGSIRIIEKD